MFDPRKAIEAQPHITVAVGELEHFSGATNGVDRTYLDPRLQVERRCTLMH